jgi:Tfp pilus assembly protein PilO
MKLTPRNQLIVVAVGVALLVVVLFVVLVMPQFNKLADLGVQLQTAEQEAQAAATLLEQRVTVKNEAAATSASLLRLTNGVPENPELPSLIIELQDTAYASGVSLRQITPAPPQVIPPEGAQYVTIPLGMEAYGTWADTVDFLQRLLEMGRAVRVVGFSSSLLGESTAEEANIKLPPYYQIKTGLTVETYVIPASGSGTSTAPVPPPPAQ